MLPTTVAYIGMGANLDRPINQILIARRALAELVTTKSARSSALYLTSAVGDTAQPPFVNAVLELETSLSVDALFEQMQMLERQAGRVRDPMNRNAARSLDLDLLLFGDEHIDTPQLTVPHPRLQERLFVLRPLSELAPDKAKIWLETGHFTGQEIHRLTSMVN